MRIYLKNNPADAKFHPDPFETTEPLAFLKSVTGTSTTRTTKRTTR